jgi:hypothetical protein
MAEDQEQQKTQIGRLALRQEGEMWVAYYAQPETMDDAIELGRVRMSIVVHSTEARQAFIDLMSLAVGDQVEQVMGMRPVWGAPFTAPEHERSGTA